MSEKPPTVKENLVVKAFIEELVSELAASLNPFPLLGILTNKRRVLPLPADSKVISSLFEVMAKEEIKNIAAKYPGLTLIPAETQNQYPDFSIQTDSGELFALDIKSSYKKSDEEINGMTLGTYQGYFRGSNKNIKFPYKSYLKHFCVCFLYAREEAPSEAQDFNDKFESTPVIKNLDIFVREKWQLASKLTGSGNTTNIGSIKLITHLKTQPLFTSEEEFNLYWQSKPLKSDKEDEEVVEISHLENHEIKEK